MGLQQITLVLLSGLGVFHGIFISILLWNKNGFSTPNRLLSILMLILSLRIGKSVVLAFTTSLDIIYVYIGLCLIMFLGPLFYLYCKKQVNKEIGITKNDLVHFIPGAIFLILCIPFQLIGFRNLGEITAMLLFISFYSHFLIYLVLVKIKILSPGNLSASSKEVKEWLHILFYGLLAIWIIYVLNLLEEKVPYIIGPILYSVIVYAITYLAISKKYLQTINAVKYQSTNFTAEEIAVLFKSVERIIQDQKLFLDPGVSLSMLAKQLRVSPQKISFAINSKSQYNFNEYINRYRVNHAVTMMQTPGSDSITIASIATDSGFNSLSSFNNAFKKAFGKTPSAFRRSGTA